MVFKTLGSALPEGGQEVGRLRMIGMFDLDVVIERIGTEVGLLAEQTNEVASFPLTPWLSSLYFSHILGLLSDSF